MREWISRIGMALQAGEAFDKRCVAVTRCIAVIAVAAISSGQRFVDYKADAQSPWAPCVNQVKNSHGASLCLAAAEASRVPNNEQQSDVRSSRATEATTSNEAVANTASTDSTTTSASATG